MSTDISGTTDISWIRLAITARYPDIIKDKGADLDNNGQIDKNETFSDLNGNVTIDDKDFWIYLEKNRTLIATQIEFFKYQGENISDNNIINHLLLIESQMYKKEAVQKAYEKINLIIATMKEKLINTKKPEALLKSAYQTLQDDFSIRIEDPNDALFINNLLRGILDCDTSTFLFLAIAHECNWPLFAVSAPQHVFMRWDDGKTTFNFDHGYILSNKYYQTWLNIDENSIKDGVYLKKLSESEITGQLYFNRGIAERELCDDQGAVEDFNEALRLFPKNADILNNRGIVKNELGDLKGAFDDYNEALRLDPNNSPTYNNRGIANDALANHKGASGDFKGAIDDHKKAIDDYTKALRLAPKFTEAYFNRGITRDKLGDNKGAQEDFNEAIRLDPQLKKRLNNSRYAH
jgi:tetratricopeptide (TPR) repeat protein